MEGVVVTAAMNMQSEPVTSGSSEQIPERLKVCIWISRAVFYAALQLSERLEEAKWNEVVEIKL